MSQPRILSFVWSAVLGASCVSLTLISAHADDPAAPPAQDAAPEPQPEPAAAKETPAVRLARVIENLKAAQARLAQSDPGKETQQAQRAALAELDELLKSPPPPPQQSSGQGGGSSSRSDSSSAAGDKSEQQPQDGAGQKKPQGERPTSANERTPGAERERSQAEDSEERTRQRQARAVELNRRRRLEVEIWGHLPEKLREQLLNTYGERMVPEYEALVRKFYEALAEPAREP